MGQKRFEDRENREFHFGPAKFEMHVRQIHKFRGEVVTGDRKPGIICFLFMTRPSRKSVLDKRRPGTKTWDQP